jgi:hypothetical protein
VQNSDNFNNNKIVIDTYAWIEYFRGSSEGLVAKKFIEGDHENFTPSIVIGELSDKYRREEIKEWEVRKRLIMLKTKILILDELIADCIIISHSFGIKGRILTGDKHLKHLRNSIDITK